MSPPEATMLVLDNSEFMRNGDYAPTRWEAQAEMSTMLVQAQRATHSDSEVGMMTLAGSPAVVANLTRNGHEMLASLYHLQLSAHPALKTALTVAMLALRQRKHTAQRPGITLFVGSPLQETADELQELGAQLRRAGVALDVIAMEECENEGKLAVLVEAAACGAPYTGCLVQIPPGNASSVDAAFESSPILTKYLPSSGTTASASASASASGMEESHWSSDPGLAAVRPLLRNQPPDVRTTDTGRAITGRGDQAIQRSLAGMEQEQEQAQAQAQAQARAQARRQGWEQGHGQNRVGRMVDRAGVVAEGQEPPDELESPDSTAPEPVPMAGKGSMVMGGAEALLGAGQAAQDEDEREAEMVHRAVALARALPRAPAPAAAQGEESQAVARDRRHEEHENAMD